MRAKDNEDDGRREGMASGGSLGTMQESGTIWIKKKRSRTRTMEKKGSKHKAVFILIKTQRMPKLGLTTLGR